jgi:hypothetical protein
MKNGKRIAILFHENDRHYSLDRYSVLPLSKAWQEAGHELIFLFGPRKFIPADLVLVHVNLSVVPEEYIRLARRYPIALNAEIKDIRKRTISQSLLRRDDEWDGPAIVKSNLNYAGYPELILGRSWLTRKSQTMRRAQRLLGRLTGRSMALGESAEYEVYDGLADVPAKYFDRDGIVVEKFRPEFEDGLYHTRFYLFLGDRESHRRLAGKHPIVNTATHVQAEDIEPDDRIVAWRKRLKMDYGKLDYVVVDDEVIVLDVNKTIGKGRFLDDESAQRAWRYRAEGLYSYFQDGAGPL